VDNLYVKTAVANEGPRMKRIRPAPMGRAFRYQRRIAHIIITVAEKRPATIEAAAAPEVEASAPKKTAGKKAVAKKAPAKKAVAKPRRQPAKKAARSSWLQVVGCW
jgi:large subunit ribosomal protein L22